MASTGAPPQPTVLLADDEPDLRYLTRTFLERDGFEVISEAADGAEAMLQFEALSTPPSFVVLDYQMPRLTGLEVAESILARSPGQKVLIMSTVLTPPVVERAQQLGVSACVDRMDPRLLPGILRDLLAELTTAGAH